MEYIQIKEVLNAVNGEAVRLGKIKEYNSVSTDTRKIKEKDIFIALKGENFNGNDYVESASEKGAGLCIVDEIKFDENKINKNTTVIKVENTKKALLDLAKYYRSKLNIKVIGITGSTGKTSTKDLVAAALSSKYKVFKTKGNFNNEIGLPLMIFNLDNSFEVAVLEMGMSDFGEIHRMAEAAKPDIALITNIGVSHIEYLKTRDNILKAKMEITDFFSRNNTLIINDDNDLLHEINNSNFKLVKTGIKFSNNLNAYDIQLNEDKISFNVKENGEEKLQKFDINVPGKHNVLNALLAIACGRELGMTLEEIRDGFGNIEVTSMRLDIIKGEKFKIVNDCYNASPDSIKAGVDVLSNMDANRRIAVLGTMRELGDKSYNLHKEVGNYAAKQGINLLISTGEFSDAYSYGYSDFVNKCIDANNKEYQVKLFESYDEIVEFLLSYLQKDDLILVKASRSMHFEKIVDELKKSNC